MQTWILSVSAMILLTSVADILLPEGKTNKTVRCVMSFACLFVLVAPLQKFANGQLNPGDFFSDGGYEVQETFLDYAFSEKISALESDAERKIAEAGLSADRVEIFADNVDEIPAVRGAEVYGAGEGEAKQIEKLLSEYLNIGQGEIIFYG